MQSLQQRLQKQLLQNSHVQLKQVASWCVPVHSIEVTYQPVKRLKMDILMKMLLLTFQQAQIASPQELSEWLVVEQLFIEDLLNKLLQTGLVEKTDGIFKLTSKGQQQLEEGIFEELQPIAKQVVLYSPTHAQFWHVSFEESEEWDDLPDIYRYANEQLDENALSREAFIYAVEQLLESPDEVEDVIVIADIVSTNSLQINDIPCLEFILYNSETDTLYVRVWNTLLAKWDDVLETQLLQQEMAQWRESLIK